VPKGLEGRFDVDRVPPAASTSEGAKVSPSLPYRIASVLLALFGLGHQFGFRRVDPRWGVDSAIGALKATQFQVQGMTRTYWDFFSGFGFFVTVLLFFAAILAWQLGGLAKETLRSLGLVTWAFAVAFVVITLLTWRYFFIAPLVFSSLVALCLLMAAWSAARA
jgi:hypothetical protein